MEPEPHPQPTAPRAIELGDAIEVMTAAVMRAIEARGGVSPERTETSATLAAAPSGRIIIGIVYDPALRSA